MQMNFIVKKVFCKDFKTKFVHGCLLIIYEESINKYINLYERITLKFQKIEFASSRLCTACAKNVMGEKLA